ncbi:MAG TPA: hypothetical protein ENI27_00170 [bacterium]|nr:hypothetical protein [bacterium]
MGNLSRLLARPEIAGLLAAGGSIATENREERELGRQFSRKTAMYDRQQRQKNIDKAQEQQVRTDREATNRTRSLFSQALAEAGKPTGRGDFTLPEKFGQELDEALGGSQFMDTVAAAKANFATGQPAREAEAAEEEIAGELGTIGKVTTLFKSNPELAIKQFEYLEKGGFVPEGTANSYKQIHDSDKTAAKADEAEDASKRKAKIQTEVEKQDREEELDELVEYVLAQKGFDNKLDVLRKAGKLGTRATGHPIIGQYIEESAGRKSVFTLHKEPTQPPVPDISTMANLRALNEPQLPGGVGGSASDFNRLAPEPADAQLDSSPARALESVRNPQGVSPLPDTSPAPTNTTATSGAAQLPPGGITQGQWEGLIQQAIAGPPKRTRAEAEEFLRSP